MAMSQECQLPLVLDSFSDCPEVEDLGHTDDGLGNRRIVGIAYEVAYERPVNF